MSDKKRNVYWFLIDGLSPNCLNSCGNKNLEINFFDELISKGFVFTNVASTAAGTHTSMHSVFSSMYPSINGASGWNEKALRRFNQNIFTLTDFFKMNGYDTFRYGDAMLERDVPKSGFDVWESSGYCIGDLLSNTNFTDTERRKIFINRVNNSNNKKFVYHHSLILHELNGGLGNIWGSKKYTQNIKTSAEVFKKLYYSYNINDEDIVILSSDHGVLLNIDWVLDGDLNGERHYEQSVKTFFAIIGNDVKKGVFDGLISTIDEAPTITDLVLDLKMPGQGLSRLDIVEGKKYEGSVVYREKGTFCSKNYTNSLSSDVFYVRDKNNKYVYSIEDERCEWLIDLKEGDYKINHKDDKDKVKYYRDLIFSTFDTDKNTVLTIYKSHSFSLSKSNFKIKYTILIDNKYLDKYTFDALADLAGPYYEVMVLNCEKSFDRYNFKSNKNSIDNLSINDINGDVVVVLNKRCNYSEYFLSDLNIIINENNENQLFEFETGFAVKKSNYNIKHTLKKNRIAIREFDPLKKANAFKRLFGFINDKKNKLIDIYISNLDDICSFLKIYEILKEAEFDPTFIIEPLIYESRNNKQAIYDIKNLFEKQNLTFENKKRKNAKIVISVNDSNKLKKYNKNTFKILLSNSNNQNINLKELVCGYDFVFVKDEFQKSIMSEFIENNRILISGNSNCKNDSINYNYESIIIEFFNWVLTLNR